MYLFRPKIVAVSYFFRNNVLSTYICLLQRKKWPQPACEALKCLIIHSKFEASRSWRTSGEAKIQFTTPIEAKIPFRSKKTDMLILAKVGHSDLVIWEVTWWQDACTIF